MTEAAISYASADRELVRPIVDALKSEGFYTFWDQDIPAEYNWEQHIRWQFDTALVVLVFWSANSLSSRIVNHEASIALKKNKLIPVFLEPLEAEQLPLGHSTANAIMLWGSHSQSEGIQRIVQSVLAKVLPERRWVQQVAALQCDEVRRPLLRELDKLREENERFKSDCASLADELTKTQAAFGEARGMVEDAIARVQGELERVNTNSINLRKSLQSLDKYIKTWRK